MNATTTIEIQIDTDETGTMVNGQLHSTSEDGTEMLISLTNFTPNPDYVDEDEDAEEAEAVPEWTEIPGGMMLTLDRSDDLEEVLRKLFTRDF